MPLGHELPPSAEEMLEIAVHVARVPVPTAAMGLADMRGGHHAPVVAASSDALAQAVARAIADRAPRMAPVFYCR